jgi:hypothetical protein
MTFTMTIIIHVGRRSWASAMMTASRWRICVQINHEVRASATSGRTLRDTGASGTKSPAVVVIRSIRIDPHLPVSQCAMPIVIFQLFGVYSAAFAEIHNTAREKSRIYLAGPCKFVARALMCAHTCVYIWRQN